MASRIYYAIIRNRDNLKVDNAGDVLLFCGDNIHLFNPIFKETLSIKENTPYQKGDDIEYDGWIATFFKDSQYAQTLELKVVNNNIDNDQPNEYRKHLARVVIVTNMDESEEGKITFAEGKSSYCEDASLFIRRSKSLKADSPIEVSSGWRHVDGQGLLLINNYTCVKQPRRITLLLMLAIAYFKAFQKINEELAEALKSIDDIDKIEKIFSIASKFNARYYFFNPVQVSSYHTYKCWENIRDAFDLQSKYQETNEQIQQVHQILSHINQKKQEDEKYEHQKKNDKWNRNITILAVFLSIVGLVEAIKTIYELLASWNVI